MASTTLYITDFGDAGVIVPVALIIGVMLFLLGQRRPACVWIAATASVWSVMLLLKFGFYTCARMDCPAQAIDLVSPSGHVAASAATYGGLLALALGARSRSLVGTCFAAAMIAVVIGATRVMLKEHSIAEVIVGAAIGITGAGLFAHFGRTRLSLCGRTVVVGAALGSMLLFHGRHLTWEGQIRSASSEAAHVIEDAR